MKKITTVFAIGRWMPIHLGHKAFLVKLARSFDLLVIGIGSCYENGTPRNCIPAVEREKLLRKMLKTEGITNAIIIPVEDKPTFEEWIDDVCTVCNTYKVTHFCTGNKEDILDVMEKMGISLDVEMINPEVGSDFPYHATDIRNAILQEEWERLDGMIPAEIKPMVLDQVAREIKRASRGEGQAFIPGRQTVDVIFLLKDPKKNKTFLLIGKRSLEKIDFPGVWAIPGVGILPFETPIDAAVRCLWVETGLDIDVVDNTEEPCTVMLKDFDKKETALHFTGIYASPDERINGTRGGGSQCFALCVEKEMEAVLPYLYSRHDMDELRFIDVDEIHGMTLAYDQKRMVLDALHYLGIAYDNGEVLAEFGEDQKPTGKGVSRSVAHSEGVLHGASHTYIIKREEGELFFLLQRRSLGKDSFPGCLDISSAGHIEKGSGFLETAQKELFEELGISASEDALTELFTQEVQVENCFHGKRFIDREINKVYLYKEALDVKSLRFQPSEVSEAVWKPVWEILTALEKGDREYCLNREEFMNVLRAIDTKGL